MLEQKEKMDWEIASITHPSSSRVMEILIPLGVCLDRISWGLFSMS